MVAFSCTGAHAERYAVAPTLTLDLRITAEARVEAIALRCQIRIEPNRRRYSTTEGDRLHDLFGAPDRWADTLKPLQLANLSLMVPTFTRATTVDLPLPLTYDMEIATTKYFQALDDGVVPLLLLFSGTVFTSVDGRLRVAQVPWSEEASYPCRCGSGERRWTSTSPTAPGCHCTGRRWRGFGRTRPTTACPRGRALSTRC
ncbi:hypothetical protein GCM10029964_016390 [Kibdelosporangium lantanae]